MLFELLLEGAANRRKRGQIDLRTDVQDAGTAAKRGPIQSKTPLTTSQPAPNAGPRPTTFIPLGGWRWAILGAFRKGAQGAIVSVFHCGADSYRRARRSAARRCCHHSSLLVVASYSSFACCRSLSPHRSFIGCSGGRVANPCLSACLSVCRHICKPWPSPQMELESQ